MKATTKVNPGICGLPSTIEVTSDEMQMIKITGHSECSAINELIKKLQNEELDAFECALGKMNESPVYVHAFDTVHHVACPVPCAIVKAIEVAASLALPKDVDIKLTKND